MAEEYLDHPTPERLKKRLKEIEADGNLVIWGKDDVLQLDLDSPEQRVKAITLIHRFTVILNISRVWETVSKSGNAHFYVHLNSPLDRQQRIFWQAALGSDRVREGLNWVWIEDGLDGECFLIEVPGYTLTSVEIYGKN